VTDDLGLDRVEASGLLDGLQGEARAERAELIPWLLEHGVTVEQIRNADAPVLLVSRQLLGDDGRHVSSREISQSVGIDLTLLQRLQRAMGLPAVDDPDAEVQLRADAAAVEYAQRALDLGIDADQIVLVTQVLADGLSRAAEVMRFAALGAVVRPGATELQIAQGTETLLRGIAPLLGPMIHELLLTQLRHAAESVAINATERAEGLALPGARTVSIAFADLVGFTRLGEVVQPEDLEQLAHRFADLARDVAVSPVRFIKTIGDEVMLVSPDPVALLRAVLALLDASEADDDLPRLRAGLATGPAVSRAGDWFGSAVNLASRVTGAARAGSVLVSESAREAIGDAPGFIWSFAGSRRLKGIKDDVKLYRARHL
jgi:adenylate cyclase